MAKTSICIDFSIIGESFDINKVTELMGVPPSSYVFEKKVISEKGYETQTYWSISSGRVTAGDINICLPQLVSLLMPKKEVIYKINNDFHTTTLFLFEINIGDDGFPAIYLEHPVLDFMHDICAECGFDVIV